ncbi:hypothetical protein CLV63_102252 [Murinocardiopsis flavida]|uniref:Uncharacterized protein n=1 Tax=Murinocardiopsis flavida TaxID=645275 RepID=A0A2P8DSD0_9ACTN|nr:hypothetical protein [Murinocardiopsis flavida]PSL00126.1 hypothetical protein CLV63_102252 [Murinocardiopsis flavida]
MVLGRRKTGEDARRRHAEDETLAGRLPELLDTVESAEAALRAANAEGAEVEDLHARGVALDTALTDAMRAAYAQERTLIGARGYDDRIYRRKRLAAPKVKAATQAAEHLLTLREAHRLHGIERVPTSPAGI